VIIVSVGVKTSHGVIMSTERPTKRNDPRKRPVPEIVRPEGSTPRPRYRPDAPLDMEPSFVGGARNAHGTRISKRIACMRCGASDHVAFAPKDAARALCRVCAAEVLKTYEVGVTLPADMRGATCSLCASAFSVPKRVQDDGKLLCPNCLRGFAVWQGSIDAPPDERGERTLDKIGKRVVARRPAAKS
jgi:predicted nucleic acid-binding Zn ribbon protein